MSGNFRSGRKPQPVSKKKPGKVPTPVGRPIRPDDMLEDEAWCWDNVIDPMKHLGKSDTALAIACCEMWALYRKAVSQAIHFPSSGPLRMAVKDYSKEWNNMLSKLCADPSYRHKEMMEAIKKRDEAAANEEPKKVDDPLQRFGIVTA